MAILVVRARCVNECVPLAFGLLASFCQVSYVSLSVLFILIEPDSSFVSVPSVTVNRKHLKESCHFLLIFSCFSLVYREVSDAKVNQLIKVLF